MTDRPGPSSCASQRIAAPPARVYRAFLEPDALLAWLPPGGMTGIFHAFDAKVGGGYRMSLFYPPGEGQHLGKTAESEDQVEVRFVELTPPHRIVEAINFVTAQPDLLGEMTMIATFEAAAGGTEVTLLFENLPPGLRPEDNEAGSRLSLEQLARYFA